MVFCLDFFATIGDMNLLTPIQDLNRVGKVLSGRLHLLGIETVQDLLYYFPFRYEDFSKTFIIDELQEGQQVTIKGTIETIASKRSPRKRMIITEAIVADESGRLRVTWFGQPFISKVLKAGDVVYLSGKITGNAFGLQMVGPSYEKSKETAHTPKDIFDTDETENVDALTSSPTTTHTARIVPIYPLTAGITEKQMRFLMAQIIPMAKEVPEWLPDQIQNAAQVISLGQALQHIHFPENFDHVKAAEKRLKFDEVFLLQLRAEMMRQEMKRSRAPQISFQEKLIKQFVGSLPFELTKDQKIAAWEILQDLEKTEPMNRLIEGDVGSGKTVVAAMCMYNAALCGFQSVILVPTEVLAFQHFESLQKIFEKFDVKIGILTRSRAETNVLHDLKNIETSSKTKNKKVSFAEQKRNVLQKMKSGEVQIMVGTHALLSDDVTFQKLGLVVVDEQHRFGVEQRKQIREKSGNKKLTPHFLSMTATPIPRTFALTLYGDLDLSIIKTKPAGRKPIMTRVVEPHNRQKAYEFIEKQVKEGRQVFVICPLIEQKEETEEEKTKNKKPEAFASPTDEKKSVMEEYEKLSKVVFPHLKVAFLHGKMKSQEKDLVMSAFARGETDILVSTSVVEVGVNIPNATVMMIEGAERFGLAQLHQFRGRVGRSDHQSYCFLFTDSFSDAVAERLKFFEETLDGFALAEYDLQTRGPGEVYGKTQSGLMSMRLATMHDTDIIRMARDVARDIDFAAFPVLRQKVEAWEKHIHLE